MGLTEIDFTGCPRVPGRAYNGANGKKIAVSFQGATWLLKFPPPTGDRPTELSYSNSCFSEHLGSTPYLGDLQRSFLSVYLRARRSRLFGC